MAFDALREFNSALDLGGVSFRLQFGPIQGISISPNFFRLAKMPLELKQIEKLAKSPLPRSASRHPVLNHLRRFHALLPLQPLFLRHVFSGLTTRHNISNAQQFKTPCSSHSTACPAKARHISHIYTRASNSSHVLFAIRILHSFHDTLSSIASANLPRLRTRNSVPNVEDCLLPAHIQHFDLRSRLPQLEGKSFTGTGKLPVFGLRFHGNALKTLAVVG